MVAVLDLPRPIPDASGRAPTRLIAIDIARCLAVVGMIGAHTLATDGLSWAPDTWSGIVNGRSSILFAVLGGVSLALMSGRSQPPSGEAMVRARLRIVVRAALLFLLGGVLAATATSIAVILEVYAVLFVAALPFLSWRPRRLLIAAGVWALVAPPLVFATGLAPIGGGSGGIVGLAVTGVYPALSWITFVLVGLAIGRSDLGGVRAKARMVVWGAVASVVGYGGAWLAGAWLGGAATAAEPKPCGGMEPMPGKSALESLKSLSDKEVIDKGGLVDGPAATCDVPPDPSSLLTAEPHTGSTFEILGSGGLAVALIGLLLLVPLPRLARRALTPVIALGSMTLTVYTLHVLSTIWFADAPHLFAWSVGIALVVATSWAMLFGRGPLERLVTTVSTAAAR